MAAQGFSASLLAKGASCMDFPDIASESHVNTTATFHQLHSRHKPTEMHERGQRPHLNEGNAKATCGIAVGWKIQYDTNTKKKKTQITCFTGTKYMKGKILSQQKMIYIHIFGIWIVPLFLVFSCQYKFLVCQIVSQKCIS